MDLRQRVATLMPGVHDELAELVAIPSVADPRTYPPEECARAAEWVRGRFAALGFGDARLAETADGSLAVLGTRPCADPDAPTVLLYAHYDVQPPLDESAWHTPPFRLTEVDGRWYGRGAADCKGNVLMHLLALRALGDDVPVHLGLVVEGSEEQGTGGLEAYVAAHPGQFRADAVLVCDTGGVAVGEPAVTVSLRGVVGVVVTVMALEAPLHSGVFGGAAPDALAALIAVLATLRDARGNTTVPGLENTQTWTGAAYPAEQFRRDAGVVEGAGLLGDGTVPEMLWARPAITVVGIDCPPVQGSSAAIVPRAAARLDLRIPPGTDPGRAEEALVAHLRSAAPWGVRMEVATLSTGAPFRASVDGAAHRAVAAAMTDAYGVPMTALGAGGSIPLCTVFAGLSPAPEVVLMGVEEPRSLIHAPDESVAPGEIAAMALTEALFLRDYPAALQRAGR
ncbi:M20/M25/M40 family metallo-hydrolase [Blastococcus sp. URHD0036]|uniref:M20/M25/M40 family metallo-hydrolase n=1 Tax=Blastococcus sp. URHD0036 TaxID=1380356 RepID=UPI0004952501|nr:M20/M25/M40 family metallo-hydrolase [Blastococcus sp. URHD0036]